MLLSDYNNHHQIFTHSTKYGVIKGQHWVGEWEYRWTREGGGYATYTMKIDGIVACITCRGYVVLTHAHNDIIRPQRVPIKTLTEKCKVKVPVLLNPYINNGEVRIQIIKDVRFYPNVSMDDRETLVVGELRNEYVEREIKAITHDQLFDIYTQ